MEYLLIEYLVPLMDDIDHSALIEEWKQNLDAVFYEKHLNQNVKLPSRKNN